MTLDAEDYESWRDGTLRLDEFWQRKADRSRDVLARLELESCAPAVRQWFETSIVVAEQQQLFNWRFCLLMLLRTRAAGGL